jgi:S-layer protein
MTAAQAVSLSTNATFMAGVSSFEKVKIAVATGANQAINMTNLSNINYVVSAGGLDTVAAVAQVSSTTITGSTDNAADTVVLTLSGGVYTTAAGVYANGTAIAAALVTAINAGAVYTATNAAGVLTVTAAAAGTAFTLTSLAQGVAAGAADTFAASALTTGTANVVAVTAADFDISNLASGGTLELTGLTGTGSSVDVKDALTGTADSLNLVLTSATAITNGAAAALTVANVETFAINVVDTAFDTTKGQTLDTHAFTLAATKATSITVTGNAGLNLTNSGNIKLTMIDGSAMTGKLTATATNTTAAETIKGGTAADSLTGGAMADVLLGGDGADTLTAGAGMNILTGGAGLDKFVVGVPSTNVNGYATITDLTRGETIQFAGATSFAASKVTVGGTAVFQDFANASVAASASNALSWFQWEGNTYIVQDINTAATFVNLVDKIVKITGLVDLSASSFNSTAANGTIDWI